MCVNLNTLSPELIELVIAYLIEVPSSNQEEDVPIISVPPPSQKLARYATISRSWQHAIERHTFTAIRTTSADLSLLERVFNGSPWRRKHLKTLFYSIDLPIYSDNRRFCFETKREHQANAEAFREGVKNLWAHLASWDADFRSGARLVLAASAPINRGRQDEDLPAGIGCQRWAYPEHSLTLHHSDGQAPDLPVLQNITALEVAKSGRRIHPNAINLICSSFRDLLKLEVNLYPIQPKNKDQRAGIRDDLARVLDNPLMENLEVLLIDMQEETPINHNYSIAIKEDPAYPDGDNLCRAVCKLAQRRLRELYMLGPCLISPALWGLSTENIDIEKLDIAFPHLETVKIEFALVTYDGRWYFTGDPSEGLSDDEGQHTGQTYSQGELSSDSDSDSDWFSSINSEYHDKINEYRQNCLNGAEPVNAWRRNPDPTTFGPLQRGMILAAKQMPKLRALEMRTKNPGEYDTEVSFQCLAPGVRVDDVGILPQPEEQLRKWRWAVCFYLDQRWEVSEDIRRLMMEHLGEEGEILYIS
ncbi:hypothetical protein BJX64DRAFT_266895 [Aspergillus heterothallicus]